MLAHSPQSETEDSEWLIALIPLNCQLISWQLSGISATYCLSATKREVLRTGGIPTRDPPEAHLRLNIFPREDAPVADQWTLQKVRLDSAGAQQWGRTWIA